MDTAGVYTVAATRTASLSAASAQASWYESRFVDNTKESVFASRVRSCAALAALRSRSLAAGRVCEARDTGAVKRCCWALGW